MKILDLLGRYDAPEGRRVVLLGLAAASLSAAALLLIVEYTTGAHATGTGLLGLLSLSGALGSFLLYRHTTRRLLHFFESTEAKLREEIAEALRNAPLRAIEELGPLKQRAFSDLVTLTSVTPTLVNTLQNLSLIAAVTLCVGVVSIKALAIWLLCLALVGLRVRGVIPGLDSGSQATKDSALHDEGSSTYQAHVEGLIAGFKQLKLDAEARRGVLEDLYRALDRTTVVRLRSELINANTLAVSIAIFALTRGVTIFAPESTVGFGGDTGYTIVTLFSFALGPLLVSLSNLSAWNSAERAADGALTMLGAVRARDPEEVEPLRAGKHRLIELKGLRFSYDGTDDGFTVGPVDLSLRPGELVLITGGNGCGKSTLMKMILGLYSADRGRIMWNGEAVTAATRPRYRNLFSSISTQQHLFSELYGLRDEVDKAAVDALLSRFGLSNIVTYDGERFQGLDLSSGQRMRVAMVVALLEDRPICVFDEWTANQDPDMTRFYYETLLPELVAAGKCVLAVSHDERFFGRADTLIELDAGEIRSITRKPQADPPRL